MPIEFALQSEIRLHKRRIYTAVNSLRGETKKFASKYTVTINGEENETVGFEPTTSGIHIISHIH